MRHFLPHLSGRKRETLQRLTEERSAKYIANHPNIGIKTVETHRRNIMIELDMRSIADLIKFAIREGISDIECWRDPHSMDIFDIILILAIMHLSIAVSWRIFVKGNYPGWSAAVPVYNLYILSKMTGRPGWLIALFFIPIINIAAYMIIIVGLSNKFERGIAFTIGMFFPPFIFLPVLAFGNSHFVAKA